MSGSRPPTLSDRASAVVRAGRSQPQTMGFMVVTALGIVLAFVLGMIQVYDRPPVEFGEERARIEGLVATVQVNVRNVSDEVLCPEIRIAARDREGRDLEEVAATPLDGDGSIAPERSESYVAVFRNLTQQDHDERLDEFKAYLYDLPPCP